MDGRDANKDIEGSKSEGIEGGGGGGGGVRVGGGEIPPEGNGRVVG